MGEVRVGVGDPLGRQSTIWKIWSQGDDIYALARPIGTEVKTSLHRSGNYRHAWTSQAAVRNLRPDQDRKIVGWESPRQRDKDVRALLQIIIPESELESLPHRPSAADQTCWLPSPAVGHLTNIWVVHSDAAVGLVTHPEMLGRPTDLVTRWALSGGDEVWILTSQVPVSEEDSPFLEQQRAMMRSRQELVSAANDGSEGRLRMVGMGAGGNYGVLWDLSAEFLRDGAT